MFIETSALDSSNVELAFQKILTGTSSTEECYLTVFFLVVFFMHTEIHRIVSNKDSDTKQEGASPSAGGGVPQGSEPVVITAPSDTPAKPAGSKCC